MKPTRDEAAPTPRQARRVFAENRYLLIAMRNHKGGYHECDGREDRKCRAVRTAAHLGRPEDDFN
jgi:hypothetical protein